MAILHCVGVALESELCMVEGHWEGYQNAARLIPSNEEEHESNCSKNFRIC